MFKNGEYVIYHNTEYIYIYIVLKTNKKTWCVWLLMTDKA